MFGIGGMELFLILIFGFLIFGPDKLPAIAKTVGQAISKFRSAQEEMNKVIKTEVYDPNSDEPFKNPLEVLSKVTGHEEEEKTESFSERKAKYDKERAAKKRVEDRKAVNAAKAAGTAGAVAGAAKADGTEEKAKPSAADLYGTKPAGAKKATSATAKAGGEDAAKSADSKTAGTATSVAKKPAATKVAPAKTAPTRKTAGTTAAKPATSSTKPAASNTASSTAAKPAASGTTTKSAATKPAAAKPASSTAAKPAAAGSSTTKSAAKPASSTRSTASKPAPRQTKASSSQDDKASSAEKGE